MTRFLIVACLLLTPPLVLLSDVVLGGVHAESERALPMGGIAPFDGARQAALRPALLPN
jgi:hypothetical protein